jgi:hypothetical protein
MVGMAHYLGTCPDSNRRDALNGFLKPTISASNKVRSARARVSSVTPRCHARQKQRQRRATRTVPFVPYRRFDPEVVQSMPSRPFAVD